jgi:hypothetical protein
MNVANLTASVRNLSDLHKDAYGFRPSPQQWALWNTMDDAQLDIEETELQVAVQAAIVEEAQEEAIAGRHFEAYISKLMAHHNVDRATAIRWDMEAHTDEIEIYGLSGYCYEHGLSYDYFGNCV